MEPRRQRSTKPRVCVYVLVALPPNTTRAVWDDARHTGKGGMDVQERGPWREGRGDANKILNSASTREPVKLRAEKGKCADLEIFPGESRCGGRPLVQVKGPAY